MSLISLVEMGGREIVGGCSALPEVWAGDDSDAGVLCSSIHVSRACLSSGEVVRVSVRGSNSGGVWYCPLNLCYFVI